LTPGLIPLSTLARPPFVLVGVLGLCMVGAALLGDGSRFGGWKGGADGGAMDDVDVGWSLGEVLTLRLGAAFRSGFEPVVADLVGAKTLAWLGLGSAVTCAVGLGLVVSAWMGLFVFDVESVLDCELACGEILNRWASMRLTRGVTASASPETVALTVCVGVAEVAVAPGAELCDLASALVDVVEAVVAVVAVAAVTNTGSDSGMTLKSVPSFEDCRNMPKFGRHLKYRTPFTLPSCLP
jgi:hypothetical protein